jgi:cardiolipin-specific phospholipase
VRIEGRNSSAMATTQDAEGGDVRGRTQQSSGASQRAILAKDEAAQGRFAQWFPLSAKEGFSQWVNSTTPYSE